MQETKTRVYIPEIELSVDVFEVSINDFSDFISETAYATTADSLSWSGYFSTKTHQWEIDSFLCWKRPTPFRNPKINEPVSQVSYYDACAFCLWKKGRLPSAKEWDAFAGKKNAPGNIWQGNFPNMDFGTDGYKMTPAPVGVFKPNKYGLHDLFGNVWEWTSSTTIHPISKEKGNIIKGGSFLCEPNYCKGYELQYFQSSPKNSGTNHLGFRCVYSN